MKILKKSCVGLLILFLLGGSLPHKAAYAGQKDTAAITHHQPQMKSTSAKPVPKVKLAAGKPKITKKHLLIGLASLLVVGGAAAAIAGSGSSDDGENSADDSGNFNIEW